MRRLVSLLALLLSPLALAAQEHIAPTDAKTPAEELKTFRVPEGFTVQLVASEPDIGKPIQMAFDARGRLWVTTSRHYPFAAEGKASDKLFILSDFDPHTGKAKKVVTFADDLNIPIGILPLPDCNSCLVTEVGRIVKLTDTDGDGKADKRETLLTGFGTKDTHGMMNSFVQLPDGWIYACHGFSNESKVRAKDGSEVKMVSGNTFRFKPDGSRIEPWTFGQVNPIGLVADPWYNLYTADCHSKPITQLIRGAYYDSFGKPHDGLGYAPHVARHDHGSTALCGLAWLEAPQLPKAYQGTMVLGNVVTNRVNADAIEWHGSTPVAVERPDLVKSSDPWFRPTECKLGPDGAIYITDFYNKIIGHYEVDLKHPGRDKDRGRVWRIVYTGKDAVAKVPPVGDLTKLSSAALDTMLGHGNIVIRQAATLEMQRRADVPPRQTGQPEAYYAHRLWVEKELQKADPNEPELVRVHRAKIEQATAEAGLMRVLQEARTDGARLSRTTVDRLSAKPDIDKLKTLLVIQKTTPADDTHLQHAVKIALRNTLAAPGGWGEAAKHPDARQALAEIALGVPTAEAAAFLAASLVGHPDARQFQHVGRYGADADVNKAVVALKGGKTNAEGRVRAMEALNQGRQARGGKLPAEGVAVAEKLCEEGLTEKQGGAAVSAANLAEALRLKSLTEPLVKLATQPDRAAPQRLAALNALVALDSSRAVPTLADLVTNATADMGLREQAARTLGRVNTPMAREAMVKAFNLVPARLAQIAAQALCSTPDGAKALVAAVQGGKAAAQLLTVQAVRSQIDQSTRGTLAGDIEALTKGVTKDDARVAQLLTERVKRYPQSKPDLAAGKALFAKNCAACHQVEGVGAKVGPQLDGIGNRGPERLMEDILLPSRNVDAAFRATTLSLTDGRAIVGLVVREEGQVVVIVDGTGQEVRVAAADIERRAVSNLSPMPANFDSALSEAEFQQLIAYLADLRAK